MQRYLTPLLGLALIAGIAALALTTYRTSSAPDALPAADASSASTPPTLAFAPLRVGATGLPALWERQRGEARALADKDPSVHALLAQARPLGIEQATGRFQAAPKRLQRGHVVLNAHCNDVLRRHGSTGFMATAELAFMRFEHALRHGLKPSELPSLTPDVTMTQTSWPAILVQRSLDVLAFDVANFTKILKIEGLLDANGALRPEHRPLVHLLFRYRWAQLGLALLPLGRLLSEEEELVLRRWQVEVSRASLADKVRILERMRDRDLGYDTYRAEGVLHHMAGDSASARRAFNEALEDARYRGDQESVAAVEAILTQFFRADESATQEDAAAP